MSRPKAARCTVCGRKPHAKGIRHLPSRRFQARFTAPDRTVRSASFRTSKDAENWLAQQHSDISRGTWSPTESIARATSVRDYADRWLTNRKVRGKPLAARTVGNYRGLLDRHILPELGTRALHTITRDEVERWYDRLHATTPATASHGYALLRSIMNSAVDDGQIAANPARVRGAGRADTRHEIRPATLDELRTVAAEMPDRYRLMVLLAAWCALRFGELAELRRSDVDTREGLLRVRRSVVRVDGRPVVKGTKTNRPRTVTVPPHLMPLVREHLLQQTAPGPDGLLFASHNDPTVQVHGQTIRRSFLPAREAAGRPDLRFHDLRHTGATLAAQTGASLTELMNRLGHLTPQMAIRYQHASQDGDRRIAARLSEIAAQ